MKFRTLKILFLVAWLVAVTMFLVLTAYSRSYAGSDETLQDEQTFREYTVRTYVDPETFEGKVEIRQNDVQIYQMVNEYSKFFIGHLYDDEQLHSDLITIGKDVTGNGVPNLVISEYSGGAHCCLSFYVFELGEQFRLLDTIEAKDGDLSHFVDLDGDKNLEFVGSDWTFAYWRTSFVTSPAPRIILRFQDGEYRFADDLMRKPAPSEASLQIKIQEILSNESWEAKHQPPELLWAEMLDLIYSGQSDLAWQLIDNAWLSGIPGKEAFLKDFQGQLAMSPYWNEIQRLNVQ